MTEEIKYKVLENNATIMFHFDERNVIGFGFHMKDKMDLPQRIAEEFEFRKSRGIKKVTIEWKEIEDAK